VLLIGRSYYVKPAEDIADSADAVIADRNLDNSKRPAFGYEILADVKALIEKVKQVAADADGGTEAAPG